MTCLVNQDHIRIWICFFVLSYLLSHRFIDGTRISNSIDETTQGGINGDTVECIDIYKQPAFNHPLLKNHIIQMKRSSYPDGLKARNNTEHLLEKISCAEGTIPIIRTLLFNHPKTAPFLPHKTQPAANSPIINEYAQANSDIGFYYGAHAHIGIWNPAVTHDGEFSSAQFWIVGGPGTVQDLNTIEAGWHVKHGGKPRIFTYWTRDRYNSTGCYNLECPGFVQISRKIALGSVISSISTYNGDQYHIGMTVDKDKESGNWFLNIGGEDVGYWPASIFTTLAENATLVSWGGKVVNVQPDGKHTSTQMGSGHFPSEGYKKSGVIFDIKYVDNSGALKDPEVLNAYTSTPSCYGSLLGSEEETNLGVHFYYGGPGFSDQCP